MRRDNLLMFALGAAAMALLPAAARMTKSNSAETYRQLDTLMNVFERVRSDYVEPVDDKTLIQGAINGMLTSLDPHSSFLDARDFENMRNLTDGEYGGLGLTVTLEDGAVRIVAPTDDTPAARAGLKAGDFISHLDGQLIVGGTLNEAVDKMRGEPGTRIKLTIIRQGATKPFDVTLTREVVRIRPVRTEVRDNVGVVRISTFNKQTGADTRAALAELRRKIGPGLAGYVVDLRSNPGGLLDQAVEVADAFLERGEVVSQRGRESGSIERYFARPGDDAQGKPVVVLVDEGSASAAEIVAAALQDHRRGVVIGQRSFGKGSVQTVVQLSPETALRLTTARYYTPSGRSVQEGGVEPDIAVPQLSDPDLKDRLRVRESDLRRHLINEIKLDERELEQDSKPDPRFAMTAAQVKQAGIEDYQLDYAVRMLTRLGQPPVAVAARGG
jgi:carboxyl-terminal processing protease